jgi:hypothetical protein
VLSKHLITHTGTSKTGEEQMLSMGVELQRPLLLSGTRHWKAPQSIEILKAKHKEICCVDLHLRLQTDSRLSSTSNCTPIQTLCVCILVAAALGKKAKYKFQKPLQLQKTPNINPDYCKSFDLKNKQNGYLCPRIQNEVSVAIAPNNHHHLMQGT